MPIAAGAMQHIDSATINLIRYAVASAIFALLLWQRAGWQPLCLGLRTPLVWWAGGLGMAGSGSLVYLGLQYTRPEIAVLLIAFGETAKNGIDLIRFSIAVVIIGLKDVRGC